MYEYDEALKKRIEDRFLDALRGHITGWRDKVAHDFSEESFNQELQNLSGDAVYRDFGFARPEYVLVRLIGRMSISIGRRLGEIYDKLPRYVVAARFGLSASDIVEKFDGLELDIALRSGQLSVDDLDHVKHIVQERFGQNDLSEGLAIEIRYNFNPNDSARLRKDIQMAELVLKEGLFPIYLIFSGISPRLDAISRLTRAGWNFLSGNDASTFMTQLLSMDLLEVLDRPVVKNEVENEVDRIMEAMFTSHAFSEAYKRYKTHTE